LAGGLIAAGCKKAIWYFLPQVAAKEFRMLESIQAEINFCMHPAGVTEFKPLLCPANITAPVTWGLDPTSRWLFVISSPLFAKGAGVQVLSSKYGLWLLASGHWHLARSKKQGASGQNADT
jgi:hypothetical protein